MARRDEFGAVFGPDLNGRVTDHEQARATARTGDQDADVTASPAMQSPATADSPSAASHAADASDASKMASWWRSRYGRQLLVEVAICGGLLMLYRSIRLLTKTDLRSAFVNAREVVAFESWLGLPFEDNVQAFLLDHPTIIQFLNQYYVLFHFPAAIALLVWLYVRHPHDYRPVRNLMAFVTFFALMLHLLFPLAPPRMMSGFVDTMARYGPNIYPPSAVEGAANQIAAMPSLHFGWALIEAVAVIVVLSSRWRYLIVIQPVMMTMAIIATANHWWIDAAAAGLIVTGGIALGNMARAKIGDREWSWTAFRFQTRGGIEQLEAHANAGCEHIDPVADETATACASNARFNA